MYLLQHRRPLLQSVHDVLLDKRKLDIARQNLQLRQLLVGLAQQALLVLLLAQRKLRASLIPAPQTLLRHLRLPLRNHRDALLVLVQLVPLVLHVQDRPDSPLASMLLPRDQISRHDALVLRRNLVRAPGIAHGRVSVQRSPRIRKRCYTDAMRGDAMRVQQTRLRAGLAFRPRPAHVRQAPTPARSSYR